MNHQSFFSAVRAKKLARTAPEMLCHTENTCLLYTSCLNPASSTHRQMNDEQLKAAGVPAELVRMSCGLESAEDLIADIAQALDKI